MATQAPAHDEIFIGALLRIPVQTIQRRIILELNTAGFEGLRLPHFAVLQYPGPHGQRPGILATRAGISKQAMNQLLSSLEEMGYLERSAGKDGGRARVVRLTKRGNAAFQKIRAVLREIENEWSTELGATAFAQLKALLLKVRSSALIQDAETERED